MNSPRTFPSRVVRLESSGEILGANKGKIMVVVGAGVVSPLGEGKIRERERHLLSPSGEEIGGGKTG